MAMLDPAMAAFDAEMRDKAGARPRRASTRRSVASDNMTSAGWRAKLTSPIRLRGPRSII
jgi:hypothetical protein